MCARYNHSNCWDAVLPKLFDFNIKTILYRQAVGINGITDDVNFTFCQFFQFLSFKSCFGLLPLLLLHLSISLPLGNVENENSERIKWSSSHQLSGINKHIITSQVNEWLRTEKTEGTGIFKGFKLNHQHLHRVLFGGKNPAYQLVRKRGRTPPCWRPALHSQNVATSQSPPQPHYHGNPGLADGTPWWAETPNDLKGQEAIWHGSHLHQHLSDSNITQNCWKKKNKSPKSS